MPTKVKVAKVKTETKTKEKVVKKVSTAKVSKAKSAGNELKVYSFLGKEVGSMELPEALFGVKVNKALLSQAVRVYLANNGGSYGNTKTRSEVSYSTRKVYKQKGTGRARHGSKGAPIYVGGGIALGPKFRDTSLNLSKKLRGAALKSALSDRRSEGKVLVVEESSKASGKTKQMSELLNGLGVRSALMVAQGEMLRRAVRNLKKISFKSVAELSCFDVLAKDNLIISRDAVEILASRVAGKGAENA